MSLELSAGKHRGSGLLLATPAACLMPWAAINSFQRQKRVPRGWGRALLGPLSVLIWWGSAPNPTHYQWMPVLGGMDSPMAGESAGPCSQLSTRRCYMGWVGPSLPPHKWDFQRWGDAQTFGVWRRVCQAAMRCVCVLRGASWGAALSGIFPWVGLWHCPLLRLNLHQMEDPATEN